MSIETAAKEQYTRRHRRGGMRRAQLRAAAAALRQRQASERAWPTAPMWSAGTTCATTTRPSWRSRGRPTDPISRRPGAERLLLRRRTIGNIPLGHIQMLGKSHGDTIKAEAVELDALGAGNAVRRDGAPLGRFLADLGGPPRSQQPGELRPRRQGHPRPDRKQHGGPQAAAGQAQGHAERRSTCISIFCRARSISARTSRSAARRIRPAPSASARTRRARPSTSTARRTSSTTVCRRCELLRLDRRGEPHAYHHRQRVARRRPSARSGCGSVPLLATTRREDYGSRLALLAKNARRVAWPGDRRVVSRRQQNANTASSPATMLAAAKIV